MPKHSPKALKAGPGHLQANNEITKKMNVWNNKKWKTITPWDFRWHPMRKISIYSLFVFHFWVTGFFFYRILGSISMEFFPTSTIATVDGCIDLNPQQFRTCRRIGHHLHSAHHSTGNADGISTHREANAQNMFLQVGYLPTAAGQKRNKLKIRDASLKKKTYKTPSLMTLWIWIFFKTTSVVLRVARAFLLSCTALMSCQNSSFSTVKTAQSASHPTDTTFASKLRHRPLGQYPWVVYL